MQNNDTLRTETPASKPTAAVYDAQEVIANCHALYDSYSFTTDLESLDFGITQWSRRKKASRELRIISIALWYMALKRSFPHEAEHFFTTYTEQCALLHPAHGADLLQARLNIYLDLLREKGDTDFSPLAEYLADILSFKTEDATKLRLKLSLILRKLYKLIFDKLV